MASLSRKLFVVLLLGECSALLAAVLVLAFGEPGARWSSVGSLALIAVAWAVLLIPAVRLTAYHQLVPYEPGSDYQYDLSNLAGTSVVISLDENGFDWPSGDGRFDTAILVFNPIATWRGKVCDPELEIHCGGTVWRQVFERGVSGLRFVDLTPCLTEPSVNKQRVRLVGRYLRWRRDAKLLLVQSDVLPDSRILVVAPHPDDAEIAALGLYNRTNSSIVTLCAGNEGAHIYRQSRGQHVGSADLPAAVRVRESITVPFLAGVHPSRCANLCYADNSLAELYAARNSAVAASSLRLPEALQLRAMNLATEMFHVSRPPESWGRLIEDLSDVVKSVGPATVVLPHPLLESHADHCFAAVAVIEAVRQTARSDIRFLFYVVHPRASESHPLGPANSAVSITPNFGPAVDIRGIYSQWLTPREQSLKRAALEAMSDLRPGQAEGWRAGFKDLIGQLYEAVSGCPRNPHSFFRRAVRPNELFFTASVADAQRIVDRFLAQVAGVLKHSQP